MSLKSALKIKLLQELFSQVPIDLIGDPGRQSQQLFHEG